MSSTIIGSDAWREPWSALLAPYGRSTGDGRTFTVGALGHRQLPLPLLYQERTGQGHVNSTIVGTIERVFSDDSGVYGTGSWLDPTMIEDVNKALAGCANGVGSISIDLEPSTFTVSATTAEDGTEGLLYDSGVIAGATIVAIPAFGGTTVHLGTMAFPTVAGEDGQFTLSSSSAWRGYNVAPRDQAFDVNEAVRRILAWAGGSDEKARTMFLWYNPERTPLTQDRYRMPMGDIVDGHPTLVYHAVYAAAAILAGAHGGIKVATDAEQQGMRTTITAIYEKLAKAFQDPEMQAPWVKRSKLPNDSGRRSVTASAGIAPLAPPAAWFADDGINGPLEVTPEGRVRGLLAPWNTCHTALRDYGNCTTAPRSRTGYRVFTTGSVVTREGATVPVGRITMDTTHPVGPMGAMLTASQTAEHYDRTGSQVAIVAAGENQFGIWVSGALVPGVDEAGAAALRRSALSGDWRDVGGNLELVAALACNSPGFPVVRLNGGRRFSLTASAAGLIDQTPGDVDNGAMGGERQVEPVVADPGSSGDSMDQRIVDLAVRRMEERAALHERFDTLAVAQWSEDADRLGQLPSPAELE